MAECQICFKIIKEEAPLHSLCYDSIQLPESSTIPIKAELSIDENPLACNNCKFKIDEQHQALMQNVNLPTLFLTNFFSLDEKNYLKKIKEESVEGEIENEQIVKEECVEFNTDITVCVKESLAPDMLYYCYQCNYATSEKQILASHIFTHLFKCNLCSYTTFDNSLLRSHGEVHINVTSEENVLDCDLQYKSTTTSEFHVLTHKKLLNCNKSKDLPSHPEERLFNCDMCDYKCCRKSHLIQHNRTHTQEKPFKCNVCDYSCSQAGTLKNHMYKHTGERRFSCNKCNYRGYRKHDLTKHKRTHTQEKPFKCNVCDFCCKRSDHLKNHMYIHSGERPFGCDECDYRCYKKSDLTRHTRTHTQEKPFECNICDFCCNHGISLKIHMYKHSGERPFGCDKCKYRCFRKSELKQHNRTHSRKTI